MTGQSATRTRALLPSGLAANGAALALSALAVLVTAVVLGAAGRGQIAVLTVLASYSVVAVGLSLESGILHFGSGSTSRRARSLRRDTAVITGVTFVVGVVVLAIACRLLVHPPLSAALTVVFALGYASPVLIPPATAWDRLQGRHHAATWRPVVVLIAQQLGGLVGLWLDPSVAAFVVCGAVASVLAVIATLALHLRPAAGRQLGPGGDTRNAATTPPGDSAGDHPTPPTPGRRELITYSVKGHGGVLLHLYAMRVPLIAVSLSAGAAAAGLYSVAAALAEVVIVVSQAQLGRVLAAATGDRGDFTVLRHQLKLGAVLSLGVGLILLGVAAVAPRLLPTDFATLVLPTAVLLPGIVALGTWRLAAYDLAARGGAGARTTSAAWGASVVTVLLVVLVPAWGVVGAAASATVGFAVMLVALWWAAGRPSLRGDRG
ncbi:polysaccharide biosynthesis protein [Actinomycetospora sp. C-140]